MMPAATLDLRGVPEEGLQVSSQNVGVWNVEKIPAVMHKGAGCAFFWRRKVQPDA
jgi:hypothetical protein